MRIRRVLRQMVGLLKIGTCVELLVAKLFLVLRHKLLLCLRFGYKIALVTLTKHARRMYRRE